MQALSVSLRWLLVCATVVTVLLAVERMRSAYLVVIVRAEQKLEPLPPNLSWVDVCRDYNWRYSSIDLRPYCGYD